ncbi:MAG: hypothetical protein IJA34_13810 [Lachnospiraceae bacterium]|nr:hypothetical protein [Lachnospiraceae bacterium]
MDILQDVGSSLTGSINKAMLFVKKNNSNKGKTNSNLRDELLKDNKKGLLKNPGKSFKNASKLSDSKDSDGFHALQVKYNPSSIRFSSRAGSYTHCGAGGMGVSEVTQMTIPAQTTMTVDLIFDDVNIQDAFMWEKYGVTVGSAISSVAGAIKQGINDGYSVQAQIDGLIALITQSESRNVVFYWSEMAFAGEVTNVQATYTMFNPQGRPIRGKVSLSIFQLDNEVDSADSLYWDNAFTNLFGDYTEDSDVSDARVLDKLGNMINL